MDNLETVAQIVLDPMRILWSKISSVMPNMMAAILMLLAGYFLGKFVAFLTARSLGKLGVDKLCERLGIKRSLENMNIERHVSELMGMLAFLFVMVAFLLSAVETLGFERLTASVDQLLQYLPKVLGASLVLMIGLFVADFVRGAVGNAATGVGLDYAPALAKISFGLIAMLTIMLAIDQLEIEIVLLNQLIGIVLISVGIAVALSLGLGTRDLSRLIVSGVYARDIYRPGVRITIGERTGRVLEVGTVKTRVELEDGSVITLSNQEIIEREIIVHREK